MEELKKIQSLIKGGIMAPKESDKRFVLLDYFQQLKGILEQMGEKGKAGLSKDVKGLMEDSQYNLDKQGGGSRKRKTRRRKTNRTNKTRKPRKTKRRKQGSKKKKQRKKTRTKRRRY